VSQARAFIRNLELLKEGDRSLLRCVAGQPLDESLPGFDLFTGLWWPLRERNKAAPRRDTSWLVAKLFATFPIPHVPTQNTEDDCTSLAFIVGTQEPEHSACAAAALLSSVPPDNSEANRQFIAARRFRSRFDAILQTPLPGLEPHLRWALRKAQDGVRAGAAPGLDWVRLLDDLSIWDRAGEHRNHRDIRDVWAEEYLNGSRHASQ